MIVMSHRRRSVVTHDYLPLDRDVLLNLKMKTENFFLTFCHIVMYLRRKNKIEEKGKRRRREG